ncbi:hypothetical protein ACJX0J_039944, partial [Zea mays]
WIATMDVIERTKLNPLQSNQLEYKGSYKFAYSKTKKIFGQLELDSKHISFMILDNQGQAIVVLSRYKEHWMETKDAGIL